MSGGFPHSDIHGSKPIPGSPWLNAGYHVLHRLLLPRHPPNALFALDLIQKEQGPRSPDGPSFQYQKHTYPKTADRNLQSGQCTRLGTISSFGIQARCSPYAGTSNDTDVFSLYDVNSSEDRMIKRCLQRLMILSSLLVEPIGIEPMTS